MAQMGKSMKFDATVVTRMPCRSVPRLYIHLMLALLVENGFHVTKIGALSGKRFEVERSQLEKGVIWKLLD